MVIFFTFWFVAIFSLSLWHKNKRYGKEDYQNYIFLQELRG